MYMPQCTMHTLFLFYRHAFVYIIENNKQLCKFQFDSVARWIRVIILAERIPISKKSDISVKWDLFWMTARWHWKGPALESSAVYWTWPMLHGHDGALEFFRVFQKLFLHEFKSNRENTSTKRRARIQLLYGCNNWIVGINDLNSHLNHFKRKEIWFSFVKFNQLYISIPYSLTVVWAALPTQLNREMDRWKVGLVYFQLMLIIKRLSEEFWRTIEWSGNDSVIFGNYGVPHSCSIGSVKKYSAAETWLNQII